MAQHLKPSLWRLLEGGSLPEELVDEIISVELENAEIIVNLRDKIMNHCIIEVIPAIVDRFDGIMTFGEGGVIGTSIFDPIKSEYVLK